MEDKQRNPGMIEIMSAYKLTSQGNGEGFDVEAQMTRKHCR